jgi:regulator of replication initiation timing
VDEAELRSKLLELQEEERALSVQRVKLHERLASFANPVAEEQERELSVKRRDLHAEIDRIRGLLRE